VKQLATEHRREGDDEEIVRSLCSVLWGSPEKEARLAASALGEIGSPRAVKALCQALTMVDDGGNLRACVSNTLVSVGPPAVEELCLMLNRKDCTVRTCAAYALGMIGDARAIEPLRERLQAINNPIQRFVSWALVERTNFGYGVRRTTWEWETDSLRSALVKCGDTVNNAKKRGNQMARSSERNSTHTKLANFGSIIAKLIAAAMLFAALGRHAYDYYTFLRWIACGVCAYTAFQAIQTKKTGWLFVFVTAAIVLNPIAPLHLKRATWATVDTAAAMLLLLSIAFLDISRPRDDKADRPQKPKPPTDVQQTKKTETKKNTQLKETVKGVIEAKPPKPVGESKWNGHAPKILLVDDDPDLLDMYREVLTQLPSQPEVHTANSGPRALAMLEAEPFDLLICDLKMPKMDGLQVLGIVRRKYPRLRTMILSAELDEQFRHRAYALGADLYCHNPGTEHETKVWLEQVESLLGRQG
jgi:CheY-like chemotaxis protein